MEVEILHSYDLQNEEHIQFGTDFVSLVQTHGPDTLNIGAAFNTYQPLFTHEQAAFKKITKSSFTESMEEADNKRDVTFRGLNTEVNSKLMHFNPDTKNAAKRIKIVLVTHGNLARKAYDKETAGITKLLDELRTNYASELATLGLNEWLDQLDSDNKAFSSLNLDRYTESESKTQLNMRDVRLQVDEAYNKIVKRINALIEINGDEAHAAFILALNLRIQHYNNLVARRNGTNGNDAPEGPAQA